MKLITYLTTRRMTMLPPSSPHPLRGQSARLLWLTCLEMHLAVPKTTFPQNLHNILLQLRLRDIEMKPLCLCQGILSAGGGTMNKSTLNYPNWPGVTCASLAQASLQRESSPVQETLLLHKEVF